MSKDHFQFISIFGFFFVKKSLINKISFLIFLLFRKWKICVLVLRESVNHFLRFSCCLEMEILPPPERVVGYGGVYYTRNIHFHWNDASGGDKGKLISSFWRCGTKKIRWLPIIHAKWAPGTITRLTRILTWNNPNQIALDHQWGILAIYGRLTLANQNQNALKNPPKTSKIL